MEKNTIFVQIASYRDPELVPTVLDCLNKARFPENLKFCIAWQHAPEEKIDQLQNNPQIQIIDIPHTESKGACWARNLIQQNYNKEKYTLQIDSHTRFVKNWDEKLLLLIYNLQQNGYKKPLITSYLAGYDPEKTSENWGEVPIRLHFLCFRDNGNVLFVGKNTLSNQEMSPDNPIKASLSRFYSAHFCFTLGEFSEEVQHDPEYYFHGEEISISARAYTHGYDIFYPTQLLAWHYYGRDDVPKHWDENNNSGDLDKSSQLRNRKLLGIDGEDNDIDFGKYGLGSIRTLHEYERYAGLYFKERRVSIGAIECSPPNNVDLSIPEDIWLQSLGNLNTHGIFLNKKHIVKYKQEDILYWRLAFYDANDNEIYRKDVDYYEILTLTTNSFNKDYYEIIRTFESDIFPHTIRIIPYSKIDGWMEEIKFSLKKY